MVFPHFCPQCYPDIGMLVNAFYNFVDAYFVGGLGESQMGALSVAYPLGQAVVGLSIIMPFPPHYLRTADYRQLYKQEEYTYKAKTAVPTIPHISTRYFETALYLP